MSKTLHKKLQAKIDALQGPEWDSSDEEAPSQTKQKGGKGKKDSKKVASRGKKHVSKSKVPDDNEDKGDGTVLYIGHLPSEFEERDLKNFLQQFGNLVNLRISRSVKSGNSRGYAFCRFTDRETSKIVAETLDGYFLGKRRLVCQVVPNPHESMFYNTDKVIARREIQKKAAEKKRERDLSNSSKLKEITARLVSRERKKRKKLEALGIDYDFPGYEAQVDEEAGGQTEGDNVQESLKGMVDDEDDVEPPVSGKKKKRKDSVDSTGSASSRKRKDSIGSESSSKSGKKSKKNDAREGDQTPEKSEIEGRLVQTEKKKVKKNKKRRESVP